MVILDVARLNLLLPTPGGRRLHALREISFKLQRGSCLGVVGESGCGKSLLALSLLGLQPAGSQVSGSIRLHTREVLGQSEAAWQRLRGNRIAMVFQDPGSALNPVHPIGRQVAEPLRLHQGLGRAAAWAQAADLLAQVGIPRNRLADYPHQFSGGQRQRITIAMALACGPDLLIADEPTTALDVTIQQQILDLISDLVAERNMALILISHDLGVISQNVDRMLVMYGGSVVESGPTASVFAAMAHPYTRGLLAARPQLAPRTAQPVRLSTIAGTVPELVDLPAGCPFAGRCAFTAQACHHTRPEATLVAQDADGDHLVRCLRPEAMVPAATPAHVVESALPVHSRS